MKQTIAHNQDQLVRTTFRLRKPTYQRLKILSLEKETPMQALVDQAILEYARQNGQRRLHDFFDPKYMIRMKPGKFPKKRSDYYDEYFDRKFGARR